MDDRIDKDMKSDVVSLAMEVHRRLKREYGLLAMLKPVGPMRAVRVAMRLGWIDVSDEGAFDENDELEIDIRDWVPHDWSYKDIDLFMLVMAKHGERCCTKKNPACERCPILDLCPTGLEAVRPVDHDAESEENSADACHDFIFPL